LATGSETGKSLWVARLIYCKWLGVATPIAEERQELESGQIVKREIAGGESRAMNLVMGQDSALVNVWNVTSAKCR
jgi:hypothetical protein